jgi:predicted nucleic acid-binding protein
VEPVFWDASSLVPLGVGQPSTSVVRPLSAQYQIHVWWLFPVEVRSAFARLLRMGQITAIEFSYAQNVLNVLRLNWREIQPSQQLRDYAESFVDRFQLKAADASQLAAAFDWCLAMPNSRVFLSGDKQLLEAARELGFQAIET